MSSPDTTTLAELLAEQAAREAYTAQLVDTARRRMEYVEQLEAAADGDLSVTWQDAHDRAVELGTITGDPGQAS